jgi:hypothetical protein
LFFIINKTSESCFAAARFKRGFIIANSSPGRNISAPAAKQPTQAGGQDEMNALLAMACANGQPRRFGALSMAGCMKMNDEYGPAGEAMTDTWTCFGDPSLIVFRFRPGY